MLFVVRNDGRPTDILVQTSDTTMHAYNRWGGNSLYYGEIARPGLQGQLQPAVPDRRQRERVLGRRVPAGPVAGAQRLRRHLHDLRRHRPAGRASCCNHKVFISSGHDEYWSAGPAGQRRGRPRRRRQPRLHGRQRGLLEGPVGAEHRRRRHAAPHARLLQGDARGRQARPDARVDRHLARPALQPAVRRRPARAPADRADLRRHQRRVAARPRRSGSRASTARCGSGATPTSPALAAGVDHRAHRRAPSATSGTTTATSVPSPAGWSS